VSGRDNFEAAVLAQRAWLSALDLNDNPETVGTPERVTRFWQEKLLSGYDEDPREALGAPLTSTMSGVICVKNVPFHSVCPHHLVPYFGEVDLAFEPNQSILGLGRFERLVAACSRKLILQEELTQTLVTNLNEHITPRGVLCRVRAKHLCFMLTGREPRGTEMLTWRGVGSLTAQYDIFSDVHSGEHA
jgi:GTP cyclohydrolase IA